MRHSIIVGILVLLLSGSTSAAPAEPTAAVSVLPDFPANLRHASPVKSIRDAIVYTMNEGGDPAYSALLQRKVGSDVLVRAWFKWREAPPFSRMKDEPEQAHRLGEIFGGGITCSALYDEENGLSQAQLLDMATRGPDGFLVDAWNQKGIRHGSLSSPAYLDYLFRWCKEQIDAGVDYLFMDENTAALSSREGFDDHSLADFRTYLIQDCTRTRGWALTDARWQSVYGVDLHSAAMCPSGAMDTFDYRAYMRLVGVLDNPEISSNKLLNLWWEFRMVRDDRAWRSLTDRIHAYAKEQHRTVYVSGNGLVKYVDLQICNDWNEWAVKDGHVDLSTSKVETWRTMVQTGQTIAGSPVPVVIFHDWGFANPPFPWMAVSPNDQVVWMRTRGAEIYAAGGFFAFPVHGPFKCDAGANGTLSTIAHLTEFYQRRRDMFLHSKWLGSETLTSDNPLVSLSASWMPATKTVVVHAINRDVREGFIRPQGPVMIFLPVAKAPVAAVAVSPDFDGEREVAFRETDGTLNLTLPSLDAYTAILLRYAREPNLSQVREQPRVYTDYAWSRPVSSDFRVRADGTVDGSTDLIGFLQGMLHREMRNPPTFNVNAGENASIEVRVQAVATGGARLQIRIDGKPVRMIALPDKDGKNDARAHEYDTTYSVPIPKGRHRVTIDNIGGDWAAIEWYAFHNMAGDG